MKETLYTVQPDRGGQLSAVARLDLISPKSQTIIMKKPVTCESEMFILLEMYLGCISRFLNFSADFNMNTKNLFEEVLLSKSQLKIEMIPVQVHHIPLNINYAIVWILCSSARLGSLITEMKKQG